jgi:hypothetical protein
MLDTTTHAKHKRRTAPAYSGREVQNLEGVIDSQIAVMLGLLQQKCATAEVEGQAVIDVSCLVGYLTADIISRLGFGQEIGYLKDETDHFMFHTCLKSAWRYLTITTDIPWLRKVLFSNIGVKIFGPRSSDSRGLGALMA